MCIRDSQNAVRRMGDFVLTSCAANALQPYRQNDNGWDQGQVFFTQMCIRDRYHTLYSSKAM